MFLCTSLTLALCKGLSPSSAVFLVDCPRLFLKKMSRDARDSPADSTSSITCQGQHIESQFEI